MKHKKLIEYILNQYKTDALPLNETVEMLQELMDCGSPISFPISSPTIQPYDSEPFPWGSQIIYSTDTTKY